MRDVIGKMESLETCETLVTRYEHFDAVLSFLDKHKNQYSWVVAEHKNADESHCHGVKHDHHHWIIWWSSAQQWSDTSLVSFLKRKSRVWLAENKDSDPHTNRCYSFEAVRKLKSILMYMNTAPRKIRWDQSMCVDDIKEMVENFSEKEQNDMDTYINKRDKPTGPERSVEGMKIDLNLIIQTIMEDGCWSFAQWQRDVFKIHNTVYCLRPARQHSWRENAID